MQVDDWLTMWYTRGMSLRSLGLIADETMCEHRATWWVWGWNSSTGEQRKMRHASTMRGTWGWDVTCSCGWESRTGGATRASVQRDLDDHRLDAQLADRATP